MSSLLGLRYLLHHEETKLWVGPGGKLHTSLLSPLELELKPRISTFRRTVVRSYDHAMEITTLGSSFD